MKASTAALMMTLFGTLIALAGDPSATFFGNPKAKLVTSFTLKPKQGKELSIPAKKEARVYFDTDATFEIQKKYLNTPPISLGVKDGNSVAGTSGGLPCIPTHGAIHLVVTNNVDHTFTVSIYAATGK